MRNRSRDSVIGVAKRRLAEERRWIAQVKEGLAEAEAGCFASDAEIVALFKEFGRKGRRAATKRRK